MRAIAEVLPNFREGKRNMTQLASPFFSAHGARGSQFEVSIGSIDDPSLTVCAQYRPKDLDVQQAVPWQKHTSKSNQQGLQLEFSGGDGRDVSVEFFFDASEVQGGSVQGEIDKLNQLATIRQPGSKLDEMKRPHYCVLVFGKVYAKPFTCVITSVATKYTMFSPEGDPIRATVNLKLKETHLGDKKKELDASGALKDEPGKTTHGAQLAAWIGAAEQRLKEPPVKFSAAEKEAFLKAMHLENKENPFERGKK